MGVGILIVDGKKFNQTFKDRKQAKEIKKNFPKGKLIIEPFGVEIHHIDPSSNRVTNWSKTDGFSLWEV